MKLRLIPFFVFCGLSLAFAIMLLHQATPADNGAGDNKPMPKISVTAFDGKKNWDASALKGHVTVLNFFASWCTPCAAEMPELIALKKQFPDVRIEGVAWNDQPEALKKWLKKNGNPYHAVWYDKNGEATIALGIKGIPESIIIDAQGMIRYRLSGPLMPDLREGEVGALLKELLSEASSEK